MTPSAHERNEGCKEEHAKFNKHIDDMVNPKDGVIRSMYKHVSNKCDEVDEKLQKKVSMKIFLSLLGLFLFISTMGITYTYSEEKENEIDHEKFVTETQLEQRIYDINKNIDGIKEEQKELSRKMDSNKTEIITVIKDAINRHE